MPLLSSLYPSFDLFSMTTPHLSGAAAAEDETISTGSVTELTFIWTDLVKREKKKTSPQKNQSFSRLMLEWFFVFFYAFVFLLSVLLDKR